MARLLLLEQIHAERFELPYFLMKAAGMIALH